MACVGDQVDIRRGRNAWVLARTDRDGANRDQVIQTAGAFLSRVLGPASPERMRGLFDVIQSPQGPEGTGRFFIGSARPVLITAFQADSPQSALAQMPRLRGEIIATREQCETLRAVKAEAPWFVVARFDWRAPLSSAPWPRRAVDPFGIPFDSQTDNDWLLLAAAHQGRAKAKDSSLAKEVGDELRSTGSSLLLWAGLAVAAGGAIYLGAKASSKGRRRK